MRRVFLVILMLCSSAFGAGVDDVYTKSLLHMNGASGTTDIADENGRTWTISGPASNTTAAKFGSGAISFNGGAGTFASTGGTSDFDLTSASGTIDFWLYMRAFTAGAAGLTGQVNNDNNWVCYVYPDGSIAVGNAGVNEMVSAPGVIGLATWTHIAITKNGSTTAVYVNGTLALSGTVSVWTSTVNNLTIGGHYYTAVPYFLNGVIDEFRFSKGIARWSSNFTPPTQEYSAPPPPPPLLTPSSFATEGRIAFGQGGKISW